MSGRAARAARRRKLRPMAGFGLSPEVEAEFDAAYARVHAAHKMLGKIIVPRGRHIRRRRRPGIVVLTPPEEPPARPSS